MNANRVFAYVIEQYTDMNWFNKDRPTRSEREAGELLIDILCELKFRKETEAHQKLLDHIIKNACGLEK